MPRLAGFLVLLGLLMVAAGIAVATGLIDIAGDESAAEAPLAEADPAAVAEAAAAGRQARVAQLLKAPKVLGVSRKKLNSIAECESHGDPKAVGGGGLYLGKYQFDKGTWASAGGKGSPRRASELEQDYRAAMLYKKAGSSPWPACG